MFSLSIELMQILLIQKVILREKVISYHNVMYNVSLFFVDVLEMVSYEVVSQPSSKLFCVVFVGKRWGSLL